MATDRDMSAQHAIGRFVAALLIVASIRPGVARAVPPGSATAGDALEACHRAEELSGDERRELLARGLALAEAAVDADEHDARAHFAAVCNLGKQMETAGMGLGQLVDLYRLRRELDATLALAPDDADALTAKGALLLRLPRMIGGDPATAATLLRRALVSEPDNGTARCYLAAAVARSEGHGEESDPHC